MADEHGSVPGALAAALRAAGVGAVLVVVLQGRSRPTSVPSLRVRTSTCELVLGELVAVVPGDADGGQCR